MILKKPYALFIKLFKPVHIVMAILIGYLLYTSNTILVFLDDKIHSSNVVIGEVIKENLVSNAIYIIPIIIMSLCIIFLGIMFSKKKPMLFYVLMLFMYLGILIINVYSTNFLVLIQKSIVSVKVIKLNYDLIFINMIIECVSLVLFLIRGLGLNFRKFNFDSDITKLDISDEDREEFELSFSVDLDSAKRNRKRRLRYLIYAYKENKLVANIIIGVVVSIVLGISLFFYLKPETNKFEGISYSLRNFNIRVNKTLLLDRDFNNNIITNNLLVVVDVALQTNKKNTSLFLKDFSLETSETRFKAQNNYGDKLFDIGNVYKETKLDNEYTNYLFTFEIPKNYKEEKMVLRYTGDGEEIVISLNPKDFISNKNMKTKNINETLELNESFGKVSFKITEYDIKDKYLIKYNYCVSKNDCILSKEYIKPTINQNFDKYILKLNVEYTNSSELSLNSFYEFFSRFGIIEYKIDDSWYTQKYNFEQLSSKRVNNKNNVYIGVKSEIASADAINIVFNIRESKYVYKIK